MAYLGEKERAKQWASRGLTIEPDDPMDQYNIACAFAQMNEPEQALDLLEACLAELIPEFIHGAKHDGDLIPLHDHPRYRALIARADARLAAHQAKGIDDG